MSTLITSNISDGTTSVGTEYVVNGSAKAWANFNGTGTIATRDSFNVASLTDNATGYYTVSFTNSMSNGNYNVSSASASTATNNNRHVGPTAYAIGSVDVRSQSSAGGAADVLFVNVATCGDLA